MSSRRPGWLVTSSSPGVAADDAMHHREAQTGAAARPWWNKSGSMQRARTSSVMPMPVSATEISMPPPAFRSDDRKRAALGHGVDCIDDQMENRLAHFRGVAREQVDAIEIEGELNFPSAGAGRYRATWVLRD